MSGVFLAMLQRARHECRQCVSRSMDWCSSSCPPCSSSSSPSSCCLSSCTCCYPRCGSRRGRDRAPRLGPFSSSAASLCSCICPCWVNGSGGVSSGGGSGNTSGGSGSGSSTGNNGRSGVCDWLSSFFLAFDWIPLGMDSGPGPGGSGAGSGGGGGGGSSGVGGGVGAVDGVGGSRRREVGGGGGSGAGGVVEGSGGEGGVGLRRGISGGGGVGLATDDVKPLLSESESFEFREKERRFVKGRFVMPGSDVQRKIAEAMAGMLAAGGRVMTRTDSSGSAASSGRTGSNKGFNPSRHSGASAADSGDGYSEIVDEEPAGSGVEGGVQCRPLRGDARPLGGSGRGRSGSRGSASRKSSPSRRRGGGASPSPLENPRGGGGEVARGGGVGIGAAVQEQERECVICMDDFSKEDPEMLTLCSCGVNKTFFHYSCLLQWLAKHSYCPACRGYLFFEERHMGAEPGRRPSTIADDNSGSGAGSAGGGGGGGGGVRGRGRGSAGATSEDYGQTLQRALRAGLDGTEDGGGAGAGAGGGQVH